MKHVLVLDDEFFILDLCKRLLNAEGLKHDLAPSIESAEKYLGSSTPYDLLICDLNLPDGNGVDFMETFMARFPGANLIVMTGKPHLLASMKFHKLSKTEYIIKPFDVSSFMRLVKKCLGMDFAMDEVAARAGIFDRRTK